MKPYLTILKSLSIILFVLASIFQLNAQSLGDYRSAATGSWTVAGNWQRFNGVSRVGASVAPTSTDGVITIQSPHVITVTTGITIDQLVINSGATITVNSPGIVTLVNGAGDEISISGTFNLNNAATLTGTGTVFVANAGTFNWSAGTISRNVATTISPAGTMTIPGIGGTSLLNGNATITNNGNINWTGTGNINCNAGGSNVSITNNGSFSMNANAQFANSGGGSFTINNAASGTISKTTDLNVTIRYKYNV
jgi:hypothetical protein